MPNHPKISKVWITRVILGEGLNPIEGVFSSRKKAQERADDLEEMWPLGCFIEEYVIDK